MYGAFDSAGRLIGTMHDVCHDQWWGGRPVAAADISAVAVLPEARGTRHRPHHAQGGARGRVRTGRGRQRAVPDGVGGLQRERLGARGSAAHARTADRPAGHGADAEPRRPHADACARPIRAAPISLPCASSTPGWPAPAKGCSPAPAASFAETTWPERRRRHDPGVRRRRARRLRQLVARQRLPRGGRARRPRPAGRHAPRPRANCSPCSPGGAASRRRCGCGRSTSIRSRPLLPWEAATKFDVRPWMHRPVDVDARAGEPRLAAQPPRPGDVPSARPGRLLERRRLAVRRRRRARRAGAHRNAPRAAAARRRIRAALLRDRDPGHARRSRACCTDPTRPSTAWS